MENKDNLKIGIDIDDVIAEFRKGFLNYYKKQGNDFDFWEAYKSNSVKEFFTDWNKVDKDIDDFHYLPELEELDLVEGSSEVVNSLFEQHEIVFITSRPKEHKNTTRRFMKKYFPESLRIVHSEEMDKSIDENKKHLTKGEICEEESVDVMIEDNSLYAKDCAERGIFVFLLEKPWNKEKDFNEYQNIEKVKDWNEIYYKLNKIRTNN